MNLVITTAAIVMSMCMTAAENQESKFYYNTEMENEQVTAKYVYEQVAVPYQKKVYRVLEPRRKYGYTYDADQRLTTQVTYKWTGKQWSPESRLTYIYAEDSYTVSYALWDGEMQHFTTPLQKMVYSQKPEQAAVEISSYRLSGGTWVETSHVLAPTGEDVL